MALNFPNSPTVGQVYIDADSGFSYEWDGVLWKSYSAASSGQIKILDDISSSFNGIGQTFALTSNGSALTPPSSASLIINLGGVVQDPSDDYSVSGSNIVFSTPPSGGLSFSGISLGGALPINTIPDGTITSGSFGVVGVLTASSLSVSGITTLGSSTGVGTVTVGSGLTALLVEGDARVTGILTIGTASITLDGSSNTINVGTGVTISGAGEIQASSLSIGGQSVSTLGVGIATESGTVGVGATVLDFRGAGISTVTVADGVATINVTGGESYWVSTAAGIHTLSSVGIGTTNPTQKLHVQGNGLITSNLYVGSGVGVNRLEITNAGQDIFRPNGKILLRGGGGQSTRNSIELTNNSGVIIDGGSSETYGVELKGGGGPVKVTQGNFLVGTGVTIDGNSGIITATSFYGDGSQLSGISAGLTTEASTGGLVTLDLAAQDHKITATGITTITVSGGTEGDSHTVRIVNSGIATVGFSTYFLFPSGSTPTLPTADGAISLLSFTVHRVGTAGTQLLAGASLNFS